MNGYSLKKQAKKDFEKLKELEEVAKPISTTMDEWIHNQGWLTSYTYIHIYSNKFQKDMIFIKTLLKKTYN